MTIFSWLSNKQRKNDTAAPVDGNPVDDNIDVNTDNKDATSNHGDQEEKQEKNSRTNLFQHLKQGLKRTRSSFTAGISRLFLGKKIIDADLLEELETQLLTADVGLEVTRSVVKNLTDRVARHELNNPEALFSALQSLLYEIIAPCSIPLSISAPSPTTTSTTKLPFVILLVGVNGSGKTTTIGKLAQQLQSRGKTVLLAAGDTFRAAAIDQLKVWGERNNVAVIAQQSGADSAAVIYDAMQAGKARAIDVVIADTAGRLHTQSHLMDELKKIKRIIQKVDTHAPHEVLLVLDATVGQNAINQARQFNEAIGVSGLCITKLDGTAKGGIIFAIAQQLKLPIRFIGVGESIDDLQPFNAEEFVKAIFNP